MSSWRLSRRSMCACIAILGAWWLQPGGPEWQPPPRPVHDDLPRTVQVLDAEDAAYLAALYGSFNVSWPQTYFNLLVRRWSMPDERLAGIFKKVVGVANSLPGGSGDYAITNDFFSYRRAGVAQFAPKGLFHMDCDFWKVDPADGFNLWVLIDHSNFSESFDIVERSKNRGLYDYYNGGVPLYLLPRNKSDPSTAYMPIVRKPRRYRSGHRDSLNWRVSLQIALQLCMEYLITLQPEWFIVPGLNLSHVELGVGKALVLREQELHRSDILRPLTTGQHRLAVGFKMQRRNAALTGFDMTCTSQQDRMNLPSIWERLGDAMPDIYMELLEGRELQYLGFWGRFQCLAQANMHTLAAVVLVTLAAGPVSSTLSTGRAVAWGLLASSLALGVTVAVQWRWFFSMAEANAAEGARLRSAILP